MKTLSSVRTSLYSLEPESFCMSSLFVVADFLFCNLDRCTSRCAGATKGRLATLVWFYVCASGPATALMRCERVVRSCLHLWSLGTILRACDGWPKGISFPPTTVSNFRKCSRISRMLQNKIFNVSLRFLFDCALDFSETNGVQAGDTADWGDS